MGRRRARSAHDRIRDRLARQTSAPRRAPTRPRTALDSTTRDVPAEPEPSVSSVTIGLTRSSRWNARVRALGARGRATRLNGHPANWSSNGESQPSRRRGRDCSTPHAATRRRRARDFILIALAGGPNPVSTVRSVCGGCFSIAFLSPPAIRRGDHPSTSRSASQSEAAPHW